MMWGLRGIGRSQAKPGVDKSGEHLLQDEAVPAPEVSTRTRRYVDWLRHCAEVARACSLVFNPSRRAFLKDIALLLLSVRSLLVSQGHGSTQTVENSQVRRRAPTEGEPPEEPSTRVHMPLHKLRLTSPIHGIVPAHVPATRLPNAKRSYRSGLHEGVDLYCPYGTTVHAVADGIVTRADRHFVELSPQLHHLFLVSSRALALTPPDMLLRLKGRTVEIDHGLTEGVRTRSVYGHLSDVCVEEGQRVARKDVIGAAGNSGTTDGIRGSREGAHLHLEIRVQHAGEPETYLGEGASEQEVRRALKEVFNA